MVELHIAMPAQWIEANPLVEETRNHLALKRGPIVSCFESIDLPAGVGILDVTLSPSATIGMAEDPALTRLLPGIVTLRAKIRLPETADGWNGQLYRRASRRKTRPVEVQ